MSPLHAAACASPKQLGNQGKQYTTVVHGDISGTGHTETSTIPPGVRDASVDVLNPWCQVVRGQLVQVTVPDLPGITPVFVHRNGNALEAADFTVTLWCQGEKITQTLAESSI